MQMFSYLGMGFLLLHVDNTVKFWSSVYYVGHFALPVVYLVTLLVVKPILKRGKSSISKTATKVE